MIKLNPYVKSSRRCQLKAQEIRQKKKKVLLEAKRAGKPIPLPDAGKKKKAAEKLRRKKITANTKKFRTQLTDSI